MMKSLLLNGAVGLMLGFGQFVYADATTPNAPFDHYRWSNNLSEGAKVYSDRSYIFTEVPADFIGADYLLTSNADKLLGEGAEVTFAVDEAVTLFVAHDVRIDSKPGWLANWTDTGEQVVTTDATLAVFSKDFVAGDVVIGGNAGIARSSMYSVFMLPQEAPADVEAPSQPAALSVNALSASSLDLSWSASADNVGVAGYVILRDGAELTTTSETSFVDQGLPSETEYSYAVMAYDDAGNFSLVSDAVSNATLAVVDPNSSSKPAYAWRKMAIGQTVYSDRDFSFIDVPAELTGVDYALTANADKLVSSDNFFSFIVNDHVIVYVARDQRISTLPAWLSDWSSTGETLTTSDAILALYSKTFAPGTVTLGGNSGISRSSMYSVAVKKQGTATVVDSGSETVVPVDHMPDAQPDSVILDSNSSATFNVLANDTGLEDGGIVLSLVSPAGQGVVSVNADLSITYTPNGDYTGNDGFMYQVTDADGDIAVGSVTIQVDAVSVKCNY